MIGAKLADSTITGKLGSGGMGEVWRAEDEMLGREVALEVLDFGLTKAWEADSTDAALGRSAGPWAGP